MSGSKPEFRMDPLTRRWVILAKERSMRPHSGVSGVDDPAKCPFCPGNLRDEVIWSVPSEDERVVPWRLVLIPNRYPALSPTEKDLGLECGTRRSYTAKGFHELVVHTPHHDRQIQDMDTEEVALILQSYRRRYRELARQPFVREIAIVSNCGHAAGASLKHSHSQIFTLPYASHHMHDEIRHCRMEVDGECVPCTMLEEAREDGRVVLENENFTAFTPFASAVPYETWFMSRRHEPYFSRATDEELDDAAQALQRTLRALADIHGDLSYNLYVRSAPCDGEEYDEYHWRLGLLPRLTTIGGFEMSTHIQIEIVPPEDAARLLREAL